MPLGYWLASSKLPDPLLHHQSVRPEPQTFAKRSGWTLNVPSEALLFIPLSCIRDYQKLY
jgi:hypothetical protein